MLFKIDFTRPHLYEDVVTLNQGNLSTNNTLRCRIVTGGNDDVTGASIVCTFVINGKQVFESGKVVDGPRGIVDVVFPSEALVVGENTLEFLVNRIDGSVAQSPVIKYRVWQGLTTDEGVRADSNYPLLVELINQANSAVNSANEALEGANSVIAQGDELKASVDKLKADCIASVNSFTEENSAKIDNVITQNVAKIDAAIVKNEASIVKADAAAEKAILAANNSDTKTAENIKNVNAAIAAGTQDLEVKAARVDMDGVEHDTLKLRLESDLKKGKVIEETKEGTYLSFNDTVGGIVSDIEVLGNTVQDVSNLANIRSSCIPNGDGTFKMSILSCGENLIPSQNLVINKYYDNNGNMVVSDNDVCDTNYYRINSNSVTLSRKSGNIKKPIKILTYNKDKVFIQRFQSTSLADNVYSVSFNSDVKYVRIGHSINDYDLKLQEGTVATPYTPYEKTRCDIKLPCQLEKWDRLYFDKVENAWCVSKGTCNVVVSNSLPSYASQSSNGTFMLEYSISDIDITSNDTVGVFCDKFISISASDQWSKSTMNTVSVSNGKKIKFIIEGVTTLEQGREWVDSNNPFIKYKSTSKKIVLPKSEQIKLNSFANKTHIYTISGEVDATVKATVSKSLASTVQANTEEISKINNTIADIQGLKESQDFAYETDKGYLVCKDTQNGVVKDLKVYGKSLVNDGGAVNKEFTQFSVILNSKKMLTPNKEYTLIIENKTNTDLIVYTAEEAIVPTQNINLKANSTTMKKIVSQSTVNSLRLLKSNTPNSNLFNLNVLLLEGDHTQNPPQYFEGIASVGNGNEIEVSSVNSNILDKDKLLSISTTVFPTIKNNGFEVDYSSVISIPYYEVMSTNEMFLSLNVVKKGSGDVIVRGYKNIDDLKSSSNFTFNKGISLIGNITGIQIPMGTNFIAFHRGNSSTGLVEIDNIMVTFDSSAVKYISHKIDKKPILFKDTDGTWKPVTELRGIDLNNYDTIENGLLKVRCKKIQLSGVENIIKTSADKENSLLFAITEMSPNNDNRNENSSCISDKFVTKSMYNEDIRGCYISKSGILYIRINKSELETLDSNGMKKWCQINKPVFIVPTIEKVYDVNPLDLQSFENETMISFGSGVIAPYASWKITSSLPNFVQNIEDRVCRLENDAYKVNLANFAVALNMLDMKVRLESLEAPIN